MKQHKGPLTNIRVLKKSMIFLQSTDDIIPTHLLKNPATFSPGGNVITLKSKHNYKNTTSYVTFAEKEQAAVAIIALNHLNPRLGVLFGTVQYCKYFARKAQCRNQGCVFLHVRDKANEIIVDDQIDEEVYDEHYEMALKILEEEHFKTVQKILKDAHIDESNLIKRGLRLAAQELNMDVESGPLNTIQKENELFDHSTEGSEILENRQELAIERANQETNHIDKPQEISDDKQEVEQPKEQIIKGQDEHTDFSVQECIKIRLVKNLIRQNKSKICNGEDINKQHIDHRSHMMLYTIVEF